MLDTGKIVKIHKVLQKAVKETYSFPEYFNTLIIRKKSHHSVNRATLDTFANVSSSKVTPVYNVTRVNGT